MSITTYTELQTAVANWLSRDDLTALIPDFITLTEAKFNRTFRTRNMEAITSLTPASGICALPSDFLQFRRVYIDGSDPYELEYLTPENFYLKYPQLTTWSISPSRYFTIQGSNLYLSDTTTTNSVKVLYYQSIPALASNSTNWLLTNHPDIYLYGTLAEAANKTKNMTDSQQYNTLVLAQVAQLDTSDKHSKFSGSTLRVISA